MKPRLIHSIDHFIEYQVEEKTLFRYVYRPETPPEESPKPYFHPVKSLAGNVLTNFRPVDHPWHHALCMTLTRVGELNFWGGSTYRRGAGYRMEKNHGEQRHVAWRKIQCDAEALAMEEELHWMAPEERIVFQELRTIAVPRIDTSSGCYILDLGFQLNNVSQEILRLGTYHSMEGLEGSHYTGLFFRGPRGFLSTAGENGPPITADGNLEGEGGVHGSPASWLALRGGVDGSLARNTILFLDHPENHGFPNRWFVRQGMPAVSFPFVSEENMELKPGGILDLRYRIVIADGDWPPERIAAFCSA